MEGFPRTASARKPTTMVGGAGAPAAAVAMHSVHPTTPRNMEGGRLIRSFNRRDEKGGARARETERSRNGRKSAKFVAGGNASRAGVRTDDVPLPWNRFPRRVVTGDPRSPGSGYGTRLGSGKGRGGHRGFWKTGPEGDSCEEKVWERGSRGESAWHNKARGNVRSDKEEDVLKVACTKTKLI